MNKDELVKSLHTLHSELNNIENVDTPTREKIESMLGDIERSLEDEKNQADTPRHQPLRHSLEDSIEHFEVSHPRLTSIITHVISTLNAMGI